MTPVIGVQALCDGRAQAESGRFQVTEYGAQILTYHAVVGIDSFGASAPAKKLFEHFGFTPENVTRIVAGLL